MIPSGRKLGQWLFVLEGDMGTSTPPSFFYFPAFIRWAMSSALSSTLKLHLLRGLKNTVSHLNMGWDPQN